MWQERFSATVKGSAALGWQATKRQLELNIPVDHATAEEVKGRRKPKASA